MKPTNDLLLRYEAEVDIAQFAVNKKWAKGPNRQAVRLSSLYRDAKKNLRSEFRRHRTRAELYDGPVAVTLLFVSAVDIDAPDKCLFDALTKSVIVDDAQIVDRRTVAMNRHPGYFADSPRFVLEVKAL